MPSYDFWCEEHGKTESLWCEVGQKFHPCRVCGKPAEQRWLKCANVDRAAFAFWNNFHDPGIGVFTDKSRYHEAVKRSGHTVYEPGMDQEAKQNNQRYLAKQEKELKETIGNWMAEHTLDEV